MRFELYTSGGEKLKGFKVLSYELSSGLAAACDGLRLYLYSETAVSSIQAVYAFQNGKKIFNGSADKIQIRADNSGYTLFVYARSGAAVLVDNEAYPGQYNCPTSKQLWYHHARPFGFSCGLPEVFSQSEYVVSKGQSCFGAIDRFMQYACGKSIYVTPEMELRVFETPGKVKTLDAQKMLSACVTVDQSSVISRIDYKTNSAEKYVYRLESRFAAEKGISARKLINLSSLPVWQREAEAQRQITRSLENYFTVTVMLAGDADLCLADLVYADLERLGVKGVFEVCALIRKKNAGGTSTSVTLRKEINGELINYVAEQEF